MALAAGIFTHREALGELHGTDYADSTITRR
jgi:hypothetical protein